MDESRRPRHVFNVLTMAWPPKSPHFSLVAVVPQPGPFGAVAAFTSTPQLDLVAAGESAADFQMSTAASAVAASPGGVSAWGKACVQICCS